MISYDRYLRLHGIYDPQNPVLYLKMGVIKCWMEPGFYKFWHKWNPPFGYLTYRLYAILRINRYFRIPATLITFMVCGFAHDLVGVGIIGKLTPRSTFIFLFFGVLSLLSRNLQRIFHQNNWSTIANICVNILSVCISFIAGFYANELFLDKL